MDEDFDFDDGGGSPEDYGMTQADFDAATEAGRDVFSDNLGGDDAEGFSSFALDLTPRETYRIGRGATATNPFPESIFSKIFGAENVDYRNILGTGGISDIENLRFRQGMGMPSLKTGQPFKMGDFYVGQPTVQGQVEELPRGGILGLIEQVIPGISTLANIFGRNRGLPKNSQAYQDELKRIQESQDNIMESFKPVTDFVGNLRTVGGDLIDKFYGGIGSLERNFRDAFTGGGTTTNPMNMPMAAIRDEVPQFNYGNIPSGFTFGSMPMNTGVASVDPRAAQNANRNVAEAIKDLQLIPEGTLADSIGVRNQVAQALDPELKAFIDRQPSIDQRMTELEDERSVRQIQENANKIRRDAIEAYKNPNTRLSNNLTMHIERFKIRNR